MRNFDWIGSFICVSFFCSVVIFQARMKFFCLISYPFRLFTTFKPAMTRSYRSWMGKSFVLHRKRNNREFEDGFLQGDWGGVSYVHKKVRSLMIYQWSGWRGFGLRESKYRLLQSKWVGGSPQKAFSLKRRFTLLRLMVYSCGSIQ